MTPVETRDELRRAVNPKTAMLHFTNFANAAGQIKVDEFAKLGKELKVSTFIDAAADTPPISHLSDYTRMGYDLAAFSGGKVCGARECARARHGAEVAVARLEHHCSADATGRSQT